MTVEFAIARIPLLMEELGYSKNYIIRWRNFQLAAGEIVSIDASNEYFLLIEPVSGIVVTSKSGIFDLSDTSINEMQYEHKGKIKVTNNNMSSQLVLFIQVIPNHF